MASGIRMVHQSYTGVVERWGKMRGIKTPGLSYVAPMGIDQLRMVPRSVQRIDLPKQSVITKENAPIDVDGMIYYKVTNPQNYLYNVQDADGSLQQLALAGIRNVIGGMTLDETLAGRDKIGEQLHQLLNKDVKDWGLEVSRVDLKDIQPPAEIQEALRKQLEAERQSRSTLITADATARSVKIQAEGLAQATLIKAHADAEAWTKVQTAKNTMTQQELEAIKNAGATPEVVALKQVDALAQLANGKGTTVVVPTSLSRLGGLTTMLSKLFNKSHDKH
jgi:regulator of protease activity HflC (stomatin/prohibitin superfamily)